MTRLSRIKNLALRTGLYRPARFLQRHVLHRSQLITFRRDLQFFGSLVAPGSLCFDVGANIGDKTEVFLRLGAKVVAFEPQLNCLHELKVRCERFGGLTTIGAAVGSESAIATLHIHEGHANSSLIEYPGASTVARYDVPVVTLDAAIAKYGIPDYCKIDVEGWELEVIRGLSHPIPLISFEYHAAPRGLEDTLAALDRLSRFGSLDINITPAEVSTFHFESWMSLERFLAWFPDGVLDEPALRYGDIFVRIQSAGRH